MRKFDWPTKKLGRVVVGVILAVFAGAFFIMDQYWQSLVSLVLIIVLLKEEQLKNLTLSKDGLRTEFEVPREKIEQDIKENELPVTKRNFINFKEIEEKVLQHIQSEIGGTFKEQIHYVFGKPPNIEFSYTPDATFQTDEELILVEIKYVSRPEYVDQIINGGIDQLRRVLNRFSSMAGKRLVAKLVLASDFSIDLSKHKRPKNIELTHYQL